MNSLPADVLAHRIGPLLCQWDQMSLMLACRATYEALMPRLRRLPDESWRLILRLRGLGRPAKHTTSRSWLEHTMAVTWHNDTCDRCRSYTADVAYAQAQVDDNRPREYEIVSSDHGTFGASPVTSGGIPGDSYAVVELAHLRAIDWMDVPRRISPEDTMLILDDFLSQITLADVRSHVTISSTLALNVAVDRIPLQPKKLEKLCRTKPCQAVNKDGVTFGDVAEVVTTASQHGLRFTSYDFQHGPWGQPELATVREMAAS